MFLLQFVPAAMQKFAEAQEKEQQAKEPQKQVVTESKTEEELEQSEDKPVDVVEDEDEMKKADVGDVEDVGEVEDKPDDVQGKETWWKQYNVCSFMQTLIMGSAIFAYTKLFLKVISNLKVISMTKSM